MFTAADSILSFGCFVEKNFTLIVCLMEIMIYHFYWECEILVSDRLQIFH